MPLLKGTLDPLVLKALSWAPLPAFEIGTWLEARSAREFEIEDAALLQALHRLEARGYVAGEWGTTENNRRARYYRLTAQGRAHLRKEATALRATASALVAILEASRA